MSFLNKAVLVSCLVLLAAAAVTSPRQQRASPSLTNSRFVDTRIGAGGFGFGDGNINPGPQVPFGALRLGPDTSSRLWPLRILFQNLAGYSYGQEYIDCFSHTHVVGAGCGDWQNFCVAPVRTPVTDALITPGLYRSKFSHSSEIAQPGYYQVDLETPQIRARLTASGTHTAIHEYECSPGNSASDCAILVDVCRGFDSNVLADGVHKSCRFASATTQSVVDSRTGDSMIVVNATVLTHGALTGRGPLGGVRVFWHARIRASSRRNEAGKPVPLNASLWADKALLPADVTNTSSTSGTLGVVIQPHQSQGGQGYYVTMRVGISFVDSEGAANNAQSDPGLLTGTFDTIKNRTAALWEDVLGRLRVGECDAIGEDESAAAGFAGSMVVYRSDEDILRDSERRRRLHATKLLELDANSKVTPNNRQRSSHDASRYPFFKPRAEGSTASELPLGPKNLTTLDRCRVIMSTYYRTHLPPTTYTEADGRYVGLDGAVHISPPGSRFVSDLSLWDIYRTYAPLTVITAPDLSRDLVNSMTAMYTQRGGAYPVWPMASVETHCMVGHHGIIAAADASMKGVKGLVEAHQEVAVQSAIDQCKQQFGSLGYVAFDDDRKAASDTLDYAVDGGAALHWVTQTANPHHVNVSLLRQCAQAYRLVFDNSTQFMCPRYANGTFFCPNQMAQYPFEHYYVEGSGTEYRYYVPHDLLGLVSLYPSAEIFAGHLNKFFVDSEYWILNTSLPDPTFWAGNEPDLLTPVQFNFAGSEFAHYSQYWFPRLLDTYYYPDPAGVPGNDDYGTMSAWCLFGYLGFYPVSSTTDYAVFTPKFDNVTIAVSAAAAPFSPWNVTAENGDAIVLTLRSYNRTQGAAVQYLSSVKVNGKRLTRPWFTHAELLQTASGTGGGALIEFVLTDTPVNGFAQH